MYWALLGWALPGLWRVWFFVGRPDKCFRFFFRAAYVGTMPDSIVPGWYVGGRQTIAATGRFLYHRLNSEHPPRACPIAFCLIALLLPPSPMCPSSYPPSPSPETFPPLFVLSCSWGTGAELHAGAAGGELCQSSSPHLPRVHLGDLVGSRRK